MLTGRGLYSLVDWNISRWGRSCERPRRGLYSLVDWNAYQRKYVSVRAVEAYTASWIEISVEIISIVFTPSRLIQPRGLKFYFPAFSFSELSRGLYSLVDWNTVPSSCLTTPTRRGLYSLVDWNDLTNAIAVPGIGSRLIQPRGLKWALYVLIRSIARVEAYTASWIEIPQTRCWYMAPLSRLIQPRGLKYRRPWSMKVPWQVEAYTASWIEISRLQQYSYIL